MESTTIMSNECLREVELSPDAIRISSPCLTTQSQIRGTMVNVLYNPTISANLMFESFMLTFLCDELLAQTCNILKSPFGLL
jgi:hypothetical protein